MAKRSLDFNPWERYIDPDHEYPSYEVHYFSELASKRPKFTERPGNLYLDMETKKAALKISPSVVALVSYSGEKELAQGCGAIIEGGEDNVVIVLTSANLIRDATEDCHTLPETLKIEVFASDEKSYNGEIVACDFHYNLLAIKFKAASSLPFAVFRKIDDSLSFTSDDGKSFLRPHCTRLKPGDPLIAVGRYFASPFDLMVAPGTYSLQRCDYDCKELFHVTCNITRCGDGGPLINLSGEVMAIYFYNLGSMTVCLPINVVLKWWDHFRIKRQSRHLDLGIRATNFYAVKVSLIDRMIRRFPSISQGAIIEKVIPGSAAHSAGLKQDDLVFECNGKTIKSFLELWELLWDQVGEAVEVRVARPDSSTCLSLTLPVVEAASDKLNRWPRWELAFP